MKHNWFVLSDTVTKCNLNDIYTSTFIALKNWKHLQYHNKEFVKQFMLQWNNVQSGNVMTLKDVQDTLFFIAFFHYHLSTLYPLPPPSIPSPLQRPHCCLCPWVLSLFSLLLNTSIPNPQPPTPRAVSLLCSYESVSILLVSSVCSLDSTYEWDRMVFDFLWLAYFT